jgi:hypothetical protein
MTFWTKSAAEPGKYELHFGNDIEVVVICTGFELSELKYVLAEAGF